MLCNFNKFKKDFFCILDLGGVGSKNRIYLLPVTVSVVCELVPVPTTLVAVHI